MGRLLARNFSGPSIFCNGTTIAAPTSPLLTSGAILDTVSYSVWVHVSSSPGYSIFDVTSGNSFGLRYTGTKQFALWYNGTQILASAVSHWRKWVHVAATYDRVTGACAIYLNGALSSSTVSSVAQATPTNLKIANGVYSSLLGYIAEPAIFNRALTAEEIRTIYEQGPDAYPKDGSCVLDYRFKEGAVGGISNEIIDYSGKGNHGQLTMGSGRIDPYNIPVPNRVLIPGNMSLVGIESTGTNGLNITDANLAAAFGVATGEVGINGISAGAWIKKKRHVTNYQTVASKGVYGASGWGGSIDLQTSINTLSPISYGASSVSVINANKNCNNYSHATWVNGISYGKCFHAGIKTRHETKTLTGNGSNNFSLISAGAGNITTVSMPFLANRILTDSEVYNIYSKSTFPPDVLFWHGPDETGTKIACYRGTYSPASRIPSCDGTLPAGITFTDDVPWR